MWFEDSRKVKAKMEFTLTLLVVRQYKRLVMFNFTVFVWVKQR